MGNISHVSSPTVKIAAITMKWPMFTCMDLSLKYIEPPLEIQERRINALWLTKY